MQCSGAKHRQSILCREKKAGTNFLQNNPVQRYFASCPDNAFQKVPSGYRPFTLAQRAGLCIPAFTFSPPVIPVPQWSAIADSNTCLKQV